MLSLPVDDALTLRHVRLEDAEEIFAQVEANRPRLREWLPWLDRTRTLDEQRAFILNAIDSHERGRNPTMAIVAAGRIVGLVAFHPIDWANKVGEIGYWLDAAAEGRGYARKATAALVRHGFATLGLNRIVIQAAVGNGRSQGIPVALGFTREGVKRQGQRLHDRYVDLAVYAMLARDWRG